MSAATGPRTGVGLGLRWAFLEDVLANVREQAPSLPVDFFEISPENYMRRSGYVPEALGEIAARYPLSSHGLTMSLGGLDPLGDSYMRELRSFLRALGATHHSDHLCFGGAGGRLVHDLLPLPFIEEAVHHAAARIREARDRLDVELAVENISYYFAPGARDLSEQEFLAAVIAESGAGLLLDVNNVFVNAQNFGFDAWSFLQALPLDRVVAIHVAGHEHKPEHNRLIDTHGATPRDEVLELLTRVVARTGPVPVVLERDHNIPDLGDLLRELADVRRAYQLGLDQRVAA